MTDCEYILELHGDQGKGIRIIALSGIQYARNAVDIS